MPIYVRSKRTAVVAQPALRTGAGTSSTARELPFGLPHPPSGCVQKPAGISLCMIVKNEERFLEQALRSAHDVVDEIVVVDTGSTDRTIAIAKSFGATVIEREWRNDFAWARNLSIEPATKRWILFLDADEELMPQSKAALEQIKSAPAYHTALWVRVFNKSDDYRGTGDMSHSLIRVFPNDRQIRFRGMIHEFPTLGDNPHGLQAVHSPIAIVHHGYVKEVVTQRDKGARNLAIVRAATEAEPNEPYHWFNLGSTAFLTGDYETARDALERMRELIGSKRRGFVANALAVLAEVYCDKLAQPIKGEEVSRAALDVAPNYANAHFQLGKALIAQARFDEGRAAYEAAIDDGRFASEQFVVDDQVYVWKSHSEIGSSYVLQKNDEKAVEWFEKGLKNAPKAEPLQINRAKALERLGRFEESTAAFRGSYEMHGSEQSAAEYVNHLLRRGLDAQALATIDQVYARVSNETAIPLLLTAAALCQRMKTPDDERYLRAAAALDPGNAEILNALEALLRERGKAGDIPALIAAEEAAPPRAAADFMRRARRAIARGDVREAASIARRGLELAPHDPGLNYAVATAAGHSGDYETALDYIRRIGEAPLTLAIAAEQMRGVALRALGRTREAFDAYGRITEIDPSNVDALMVRADIAQELDMPNEQEAALKAALPMDRGRASLALASLYLRTGRYEEAAKVADAALSQ